MAGNTIGAKIVLDGEADYRKALKNINTEQKELRSEMKLASSTFADQQNSIEALTKKNEILGKQYEKQQEKVEIYSRAVADSTKKQEEAGSKVAELREALDKANTKMEDMADSSDESADALAEQQKIIDELKEKLSLAEDGYDKAKNATANWQTSLNDAQTGLNNLGKELEDNQNYLKEAEKSMDGCAESIDEYGKNVEEAKDKTSVFADVLKADLCAEAIKQGVEALAGSIKKITDASISVGSSFENGMSQVAATMGITSEEIRKGSKDYETLKTAAEECGKSTKYSAAQSAEALNYLALAGYDAAKSAETLPKVLNLAAAGGMELGYASDLVTDSMAALEMEAKDLDKYIDEMAKTSQKSNTSVAQLGEATLVCAGTVSLTKQSLETMNTELGVLANNGIKGAEGGTHLRNILLSLVSPTDNGAKALENYGIAVQDSTGNVRDLNDIMIDMNDSLSKLSDADKTNVISTIFNKTDIAAVNALLKGTGKEFDSLYAELQSCTGAAANMAETMEYNLTGKITILESALEGLGISAYEKIEGTLKDSVDAATESVGRLQDSMDNGELGRAMDDFTKSLGKTADKALDFAEDALPALIEGLTWVMDNSELVAAGIGGITTAMITHNAVIPMVTGAVEAWNAYKAANEGATIAQWALNGAMDANPVGLLVTAIVGLTSAVAIYAMTAPDAVSAEKELAKSITESNNAIRDNVQARKDSQSSQAAELSLIGKLKDELLSLNEKESLSTEEKSRMKLIVDELNEAMPELNLSINEQTGYLEQTNEELDNNIDKLKKSLEVGFMREDLEEIARNLYEAEKNLTEIQDEYNENMNEAEKILSGWTEACEQGESAMNEFNIALGEHATDAMARYGEKCNELEPALQDAKQLVDELNTEYETMSQKLDSVVNPINDVTGALDDANSVTITYKDTVYSVTQQVSENMQELRKSYLEAYETALDTLSGQVGLFDELSVKSDMSTQQMAQNLKTQTDTFTTYKDDLTTAAKLVEDGLMEEGLLGAIMELGVNGAGYLHELVTAAETDTEQFSKLMDEWASMETAKLQLTDTMADIKTGYSDQMDELLGLQEEKNELASKEATETGEEIQENVENALDEIVSNTSDSLNDMTKAVKEKSPEVKKASEELCSGAIDGANDILQISEEGVSVSFVSIGYSIPQGIAQGISEGQQLIADTLQAAIDNAINTIDLSGITAKINRELGDLY